MGNKHDALHAMEDMILSLYGNIGQLNLMKKNPFWFQNGFFQTLDKLDNMEFAYSLFSFTILIMRYLEVMDYDDEKP